MPTFTASVIRMARLSVIVRQGPIHHVLKPL
jgi:hypothetical protein